MMTRLLCAVAAVLISAGLFSGCMRALPERTKDQLATGISLRCTTLSYTERLADRGDFAKRTAPHKAVVYCAGDPDFPADDAARTN